MEQNNNTYKYLSIVLAIIAIIFAVLYFTKPSEPVSETFDEISANVGECRTQLDAWRAANGGQATTTEQARNELMSILENCESIFEESQEQI